MSSSSEFDLEKLFLPAWAQEPASVNRYEKYAGDDRPPREFGEREGRRRPPRRDGQRPNRDGDRGGRGGERPQNRGPRTGPPGGPRRDGDRPQRQGFSGDRGPRRDDRRDDRAERREPPQPLPDLNVVMMPDEKGVESLSRQIKISGRSFPLFDIAQMILRKPERQQVRFEVKKKADGTVSQPMFLCAIDDSLWLSEDEAVQHVLEKHFATFYQAEKTPTDPPKGTYTFVAQCGMSGVILGPPNYHDYQNNLRRLHAERFSRMPFDVFKARVKIVKEEAVVKKWIEDQSTKTEYICLNVADALRLGSREAVEKHFRETHLPNIVKPVEKHTLSGPASRNLRSQGLQRLLRAAWDEQRRFPLKVATVLSQQFASHGLQFFKVNKTITHVSVARPHFLDLETTPVSDQVKRIVEIINATPKCTRRQLLDVLAPAPKPAADAPAPAPADPKAPAPEPEPTPEQASVIGDLHWLIHQGHVIEFANGILETAKKPAPRPVKAPKPEPVAAAPAAETAAPAESAPAVEASAAPSEPAAAPVETSAHIGASEPPPAVAEPAAAPPAGSTAA